LVVRSLQQGVVYDTILSEINENMMMMMMILRVFSTFTIT